MAGAPSTDALSPPPSTGKRALNAVLGVLLLMAWVYLFLGVRQGLAYLNSGDWVETRGTIIDAESRPGRSLTQSRMRLRYEYVVDGEPHQAGRLAFDDQTNPHLRWKANVDEIVKRWHVGERVTVYHSPGDPGDAVLERTYRWQAVLLLLVAFLVGVGAVRMVLSNTFAGWLAPPRGLFSLVWTAWDKRLLALGGALLALYLVLSFVG